MTRKKLLAYHVIFFTAVTGTLMITAPPLAATPLGFGVIYCGVLAAGLILGWTIGARSTWVRALGMVFMMCVSFGVLGLIGGGEAALAALVLSVVSYWPRRMGAR